MFLFLCFVFILTLKNVVSSESGCDVKQLPCDDGKQCIDRNQWCDKEKHCEDGSDESYCKTSWWPDRDINNCKHSHFLCYGGQCVPLTAKCDGYNDCEGDEDDCDVSSSSSSESDEVETAEKTTLKTEQDSDEDITSQINPIQNASSTQVPVRLSSTTSSYYDMRRKEGGNGIDNKISVPTNPSAGDTTIKPYLRSTRTTARVQSTLSTTQIPPEIQRNKFTQDNTYYPASPATSSRVSPTPFPTRWRYSNVTRSVMPNPALRNVRHPYLSPDGRQPTYNRRQPADRVNGNLTHVTDPFYSNRLSPHGLNRESDWRETGSLKPYKRKIEVRKPFHFSKDYASLFRGVNAAHLRRGENWMLKQRDSSGDWGRDTARAITALALINNSFESGKSENKLFKHRFLVQLSVDLLRNDTNTFSVNRMAMALNALMAVCENPRDFHGMDLTEMLRAKMRDQSRQQQRQRINPFVYLSFCLSGSNLSPREIQYLEEYLKPLRSPDEMSKDMQSLAIQAFACALQQDAFHVQQGTLHNAVSDLLQRIYDDGSFGSIYSTALAAQALMSVNYSSSWSAQKTMDFLRQHQQEDGSFGNLLATYYILPTLSGRSLLHLRNIHCDAPVIPRDLTPPEILEFAGPKQYIHYSIYFGYPLDSSHSMTLVVPHGINFLDVMRVAEYQDSNFRFSYEEDDQKLYVFSVSGLPNDSEQGFAWHLYVKPTSDLHQQQLDLQQRYGGDVRKLFPRSDQHIIFWYHSIGLRR